MWFKNVLILESNHRELVVFIFLEKKKITSQCYKHLFYILNLYGLIPETRDKCSQYWNILFLDRFEKIMFLYSIY